MMTLVLIIIVLMFLLSQQRIEGVHVFVDQPRESAAVAAPVVQRAVCGEIVLSGQCGRRIEVVMKNVLRDR